MDMTILEGRVAEENRGTSEKSFEEGSHHEEPGSVQSFLVHNTRESDLWHILTVWSSREALQDMRKSNETPRGTLMFRQANTEPVLSIYDVVE